MLLCKGADQVILERVRKDDLASRQLLETTQTHIDQFAKDGLRTLAYAARTMTSEQYETWAKASERHGNSSV